MSENIANAASTRRPDGTHRVVITLSLIHI